LIATGIVVAPAGAGHSDDDHSPNIKQLQQEPLLYAKDNPTSTAVNEELRAQGTDLAFKGGLVVQGSFQGIGLYKILQEPPYVKLINFGLCQGGQGDVSIWGDYVFMSVDTPKASEECGVPDATQAQIQDGTAWEGIRIFSIENRRNIMQVGAVETDCGSHTHTLVPMNGELYIYNESYPISGQNPNCNAETHRKISVVKVDLQDPKKSEVVSTPPVEGSIGCHDITIFKPRKLALAACITNAQIWDISDPTEPQLLSTIDQPEVQIYHSTAVTWDGKYFILGDEYGGATVPVNNGCTGDMNSTQAALWIYNVEDPAAPELMSHYALPRTLPAPKDPAEAQRVVCTTHNFNIVPMKDRDRYIAPISYYMGALSVVDFSDPAAPKEIAHYMPMNTEEGTTLSEMWAAYWYNGRIYASEWRSLKGLGVYQLSGTTKRQAFFFSDEMNPQLQDPKDLR
jgi:hypothetical protein